MANTTDQNNSGNMPDNPQLSPNERAGAVAIILSAMIVALLIIIAWWPADPTSDKNALYYFQPFHVRPVAQTGAPSSTASAETTELNKKVATLNAEITKLGNATDTASQHKLAIDKKELTEIQQKIKAATNHPATVAVSPAKDCRWTIQLGSLMLILVAACGFLGNLIHVSRSLTYYIGMQQFQRSWIPWYFIKPFTASGLALLIYFATNSGGAATTGPINLFPIMLAAGLAGLFTDIATQKLKVIFEAILKPADKSAPPVTTQPPAKTTTIDIYKVTPEKIDPAAVNPVKIPGQNIDQKTVTVTINDQPVNQPVITATLISFDYQPQGAEASKKEFVLKVIDKSANLNAQKAWKTV